MDTSALTNIPPKRLAIVAVVGVAGGLLWRHFSSKKSGQVLTSGATGDPIDLSKLALEQNSAGNLGASQTEPLPNLNDATRDMGSGFFPIPVTKGVTRGTDGIDYYVDANGKILGPVNATIHAPVSTTNPNGVISHAGGTTMRDIIAQQGTAAQLAEYDLKHSGV